VNNYLLRARLGSGSSSIVYLAIDDRTGVEYAVKRIRLRDLMRSGNGIAQLEREIRLIRLFHHPNILRLFEVLYDKQEEEVCLVLEYAEKRSLGSIIDEGIRLSKRAIFSITRQVAAAVQYLHDTGYVHQDIKPCNILLDGGGRAILSDFGIGHTFQSAGMVVGSPAFQAPEALDDSYGDDDMCDSSKDLISDDGPQKEDIWALGVTLYQLLFLKLPYVGNNLYEIVSAIKAAPLDIPDGTDPAAAELLRGMLAVDPAKRLRIDEVLANPLIAEAPDRAEGLPDVEVPPEKDGEVVQTWAEVCGEGYSFTNCRFCQPRRFQYANKVFFGNSCEPLHPKTLPRGAVPHEG
jgi:serine/threonine-protein kinase 11